MNGIPFWVVAHLGRKVQLSKTYYDCTSRAYPAGSQGVVCSIQAGENEPYATVVLDDDPVCAEENFKFNELRPA
jgi:hypothetical protein